MNEEKNMTEQESLDIITKMIEKAKCSYHDKGISALLWGTVVSVASIVSFLQLQFNFYVGFDIWLLVLAAIIPQIIIARNEKKTIPLKRFEDEAIDAVWWVYGITIFGLVAYCNIAPSSTIAIAKSYHWEMVQHYTNGLKPDAPLRPFIPSFYSLYILIYAFPTLVTGIVKKFKPMIIGAIITYIMFVVSCFTETKYDMLCGAIAAIANWLVPGIILRTRYLKNKSCTN